MDTIACMGNEAALRATSRCISEQVVAIGVQRYTECDTSCVRVTSSQKKRKYPHCDTRTWVVCRGDAKHAAALKRAHARTAVDAMVGVTASLTIRLMGGSTTTEGGGLVVVADIDPAGEEVVVSQGYECMVEWWGVVVVLWLWLAVPPQAAVAAPPPPKGIAVRETAWWCDAGARIQPWV